MALLRIRQVEALDGRRVRLVLTDNTIIERDLAPLLHGPLFDDVARGETYFRAVRVEGGGLAWDNGADLCPDVVIWGGPPPEREMTPPSSLASRQP